MTRENKQVLCQAFGYAFEVGARYVVITNGDYYALFDRRVGLSQDDNFRGELWLSRLTEGDLPLIQRMKALRGI